MPRLAPSDGKKNRRELRGLAKAKQVRTDSEAVTRQNHRVFPKKTLGPPHQCYSSGLALAGRP